VSAAALALVVLAASPEPPVTVGSKSFTESVLLGEMAARVLADAGLPARHERALGGTRILWEALRRGEIDLYPDYTGTLAREILGAREPLDLAALRSALAPLGLGLTGPLGFENTYAVGVRRETAERLGLVRISDLARRPELRIGLTNEFLDRADGWPALLAAYHLPHRDVRGLDHDLAYRAVGSGEIDVTDVYTTDAQILRLDLVLLEDDRRVFPEYQAVLVHRADLAQRAPAALEAVRRLEGRLSAAEMVALNARVQLEGEPAPAVAAAWLGRTLGIAAGVPAEALLARIRGRTLEHLGLVLAALLGAVAVAVPLGVVAVRRRGAGRIVLGAVGVVQTIPSLALLVFMIPLLGIGAAPAVAALFLYGLLPIVRNTHAGLAGISPELRESALALGLPSLARLRLVELPLAAPAILAGVKTSAVITIGTATLGALIGAGGYGQPILTGIRLASVPLILEGAVPAALLALLAQGAFDLAERVLVPRGLRRGAAVRRRSPPLAGAPGGGR
jgi:osmoprotectant transport system permease protein